MTVGRLRSEIGNDEYHQWRAFYTVREAQLELARKEQSHGR